MVFWGVEERCGGGNYESKIDKKGREGCSVGLGKLTQGNDAVLG